MKLRDRVRVSGNSPLYWPSMVRRTPGTFASNLSVSLVPVKIVAQPFSCISTETSGSATSARVKLELLLSIESPRSIAIDVHCCLLLTSSAAMYLSATDLISWGSEAKALRSRSSASLTEGHAGEFFLETFLLLRVAGAREAA